MMTEYIKHNKQMRRYLILLLLFSVTSCVSTRVNQFAGFAEAGRQYTRAMESLTTEAGGLAIDADSELLLKGRDQLSQEERGKMYIERSDALRELLVTLQGIRKHSRLLERYFTALGALAGSDPTAALSSELNSVVNSLAALHPALEKASMGNARVSDYMGAAVPLVLSGIKQQALEQELRRNAPVIERELELQTALLKALSQQMTEDLELLLDMKDYSGVTRPFVEAPSLGDTWKAKRKEVLTGYLSVDAVEKAASAAESLQRGFRDLVERRIGIGGFAPVFSDIHAMLDLVEMLRTPKTTP
jgi:uncharacterized protein YjaG (DUF416 family)